LETSAFSYIKFFWTREKAEKFAIKNTWYRNEIEGYRHVSKYFGEYRELSIERKATFKESIVFFKDLIVSWLKAKYIETSICVKENVVYKLFPKTKSEPDIPF